MASLPLQGTKGLQFSLTLEPVLEESAALDVLQHDVVMPDLVDGFLAGGCSKGGEASGFKRERLGYDEQRARRLARQLALDCGQAPPHETVVRVCSWNTESRWYDSRCSRFLPRPMIANLHAG